jgi:hypothetical protein
MGIGYTLLRKTDRRTMYIYIFTVGLDSTVDRHTVLPQYNVINHAWEIYKILTLIMIGEIKVPPASEYLVNFLRGD